MNNNHYPAGSSGGKGGQFAPKNVSGVEAGQGQGQGQDFAPSLSFVPKTTSNGKTRTFFSDLPESEQITLEKNYEDKHADVITQLDYFYDNYNTSKMKTPERDYMRQQWLNNEFNDQMSQGEKKQERKATLILGLPGSGKSTIANPLSKEMGAFIVDADNFKNRIPEFQKDRIMVSAVHHESVNLSNEFRRELANNGYNMIIGKVGGDYKSVEDVINNLSDNGYQIEVILNDIPFEQAIDRTIGRYDRGETDRLIPFWTTKVADKNVFDTFDQVLRHPSVTGGKIYSNDVPKGQPPVLLNEYKK